MHRNPIKQFRVQGSGFRVQPLGCLQAKGCNPEPRTRNPEPGTLNARQAKAWTLNSGESCVALRGESMR